MNGKVLGSFESWARVMGGTLDFVGIKGFLSNLDAVYEASDTEGITTRAFLSAWWSGHGTSRVGVASLFQFASDAGVDLGHGSERSQRTQLGTFLRTLKDRRYTLDDRSLSVVSAGSYQGAQQWCLSEHLQASLIDQEAA